MICRSGVGKIAVYLGRGLASCVEAVAGLVGRGVLGVDSARQIDRGESKVDNIESYSASLYIYNLKAVTPV